MPPPQLARLPNTPATSRWGAGGEICLRLVSEQLAAGVRRRAVPRDRLIMKRQTWTRLVWLVDWQWGGGWGVQGPRRGLLCCVGTGKVPAPRWPHANHGCPSPPLPRHWDTCSAHCVGVPLSFSCNHENKLPLPSFWLGGRPQVCVASCTTQPLHQPVQEAQRLAGGQFRSRGIAERAVRTNRMYAPSNER